MCTFTGAHAAPVGVLARASQDLQSLGAERGVTEHTSVARQCLLPEETEARRGELEDSCDGPGAGPRLQPSAPGGAGC